MSITFTFSSHSEYYIMLLTFTVYGECTHHDVRMGINVIFIIKIKNIYCKNDNTKIRWQIFATVQFTSQWRCKTWIEWSFQTGDVHQGDQELCFVEHAWDNMYSFGGKFQITSAPIAGYSNHQPDSCEGFILSWFQLNLHFDIWECIIYYKILMNLHIFI